MKRAFVSWSGGKDCCLALYRAQKQGLKIANLVNTVTADRQRSCSHGLAASWIRVQSQALGIPVQQYPTTDANYREVFVEALQYLKEQGVEIGVFGDIDFEPHREWIQSVCAEAGLTALLPLWGENQEALAREFIRTGFKSTVIATRASFLGQEWLGRTFNLKFLQDVARVKPPVTPCGEAGEFHTLVVNGPIFQKSLDIVEAVKLQRGEHWFYDIQKIELRDKGRRRRF